MEKFYVITASGGSCDDSWKTNLFAVRSLEQAQQEISVLRAAHLHCVKIWNEVNDVHRKRHVQVIQEAKLPPLPSVPKGPVKPTKETLRAHHQAVEEWRAATKPIWDAHYAAGIKAREESLEAARWRAIELGCTELHLKLLRLDSDELFAFDHGTIYNYEEIELR